MSFELITQPTQITRKFSRQTWAKALELALTYGWRPLGTCPPPELDFQQLEAEWDGRYLTNDGQIVRAQDALYIATALEKALDYIPNENPPGDWNAEFWTDDDLPEWLTPEERKVVEEELQEGLLDIVGTHPLDYFAGDEKHHLIQLIKFFRCGSFEVL